jgi:lipoprotein-releasing system ATP-binding protein
VDNTRLIEARDITKTIGETTILAGVSLAIERGDFVSIIGASGSGKSSLLYILGLLDVPTSGEIVFEGERIDFNDQHHVSAIRNRKIGFVFQFHYLIPELTAAENVMAPMYKVLTTNAQARDRAFMLLAKLGLRGKEERKPYELSGGEQQRVALARALANDPSIIMADEPTGNLDTKNTEVVMDILLDLNREGKTILMVTHELDLAERTKRIIQMRDGTIFRTT